MNALNRLSHLILTNFVARQNAYAVQDDLGSYHTKYLKITKYTVRHMIRNKLSLLTYQMLDSKKLKWCCLDFDIQKKVIDEDGFQQTKETHLAKLISVVSVVCRFLNEKKINYLVEFSGNRGFHVWIIFSEPALKDIAHKILVKICDSIETPEEFAIDIFPATPDYLKKGVGQGVKLPMSLHKKSNKYSYLLNDIENAPIDELYIEELDNDFVSKQIQILEHHKPQSPKYIIEALGIDLSKDEASSFNRYIKTSTICVNDEEDLSLDSILSDLCKCSILKSIISSAGASMPEKSRSVIVGLLNKVSAGKDQDFGKTLLLEYFSRLPNYKEELTLKKLQNLKLQPISCEYLKLLFSDIECNCDYENVSSPVEIISKVSICPYNPFEISKEEVLRIATAALKYTQQNDEVSLFVIESSLKKASPEQISILCSKALRGSYIFKDHYMFYRNEESSVRTLVSLSPEDKIITKFLIQCLHSFFYLGFSPNSYGYKYNESYSNDNIFLPWLQQWNIFKKGVSSIVDDEMMADCFLIKVDIRSFYTSIDRQLLKVKIIDGPSREIRKIFYGLDDHLRESIQNVANLFVAICDATVEGSSGVPQGPAFARYLAEIYLMDFDRFVETNIAEDFGQYFRYVDDIFVVVDSESKAEELNNEIKKFLSKLRLEINTEKSFLGKVRDYRHKFNDYVDNAKYAIDHTNLALSTKSVIDNSIKSLFNLIDGGTTKSVRHENLSFFITHLSDHPVIKARLGEIEELIINLDTGRGSLFRNFFNKYIPDHLTKFGSNKAIMLMSGLKREVFLNSLLTITCNKELSTDEEVSIQRLLQVYSKTVLSKSESEVLLVFMLMHKAFFDIQFVKQMDFKMLNNGLPVGLSLGVSSETEAIALDLLTSLQPEDFVKLCSKIAMNDIDNAGFYGKIADLFFDKMYNYSGGADYRYFDPLFIPNELLDDYYFACCLFSIVPSTSDNLNRIEFVWQNMICFMKKRQAIPPIVLGYNRWLEKASKVQIDFKRITSLLALDVGDGIVPGLKCNLQMFEHFKKNVLLLIYITENPGKAISLNEIKKIVDDHFKDAKYEYLRWLTSDNGEVSPFPDKDICVKNIIYNERLVLKKGDELLVRFNKALPDVVATGTTPTANFCNFISDDKFETVIKDYVYGLYKPAGEIFSKNDLFELLKVICEFKVFLENHSLSVTNFNENKYISPSKQEYFAPLSGKPLIPEAVHDLYLHGYTYGEKLQNNYINFLRVLSQIILDSKITVLPIHSSLRFNAKDYSSRLVCYSYRSDIEAVFKLLTTISSLTSSLDLSWPYHVETVIINAITTLRLDGLTTFKSCVIYDILSDYNSLYESRKFDKNKLLFGVNDNTPLDFDNTIFGIYRYVFESISLFMDLTGRSHFIHDIPGMLCSDLFRILTHISYFQADGVEGISREHTNDIVHGNIDKSALEKLKLSVLAEPVKIVFDEAMPSELEIGDKLLYSFELEQDARVLLMFVGAESELCDLSLQHVGDIVNNKCFLVESKIDNEYLIVVMSQRLIRSCEAINSRKKFYNRCSYNFGTNSILFDNISPELKRIEQFEHYNKALELLGFHLGMTNKESLKNHLLGWIINFPSRYYTALVEVVAAHRVYTENDIKKFVETIHEYKARPGVTFGTIKNPADGGGFHRIISDFDQGFRSIGTDSWVDRLFAPDNQSSELIFLVELIVSGTQISNAFKNYYLNPNPHPDEAKNNRYFAINFDRKDFVRAISSVNKITFLSILSSDHGEKQLVEQLTEAFTFAKVRIPQISVKSIVVVPQYENTICDNPRISLNSQSLFQQLVARDSINNYFDLSQLRNGLYNDHEEFASKNLILRRKSTTKYSFKLFTMKPRDDESYPLFSTIKEHAR